MNSHSTGKIAASVNSAKRFALVGGFFLGACLLGAIVVTLGADSDSQTLLIGLLLFLVFGGAAYLALELPVISVARFAFIASFFFKADINLYKIDDMEDPSGFNLSLTLMTALILLVYDLYDDNSKEKVFPVSVSILTAALFVCAVISTVYGGSTRLGWFSIWGFLSSILTAYVVASHFSRRERLLQLIIGIAVGLLFTGVVALSQYALNFPMNLALLGTGTEDEMLGTQSQILSRVPAFLRTPTGMAWVVSALIPLIVAPVICRVKSFESRQRAILLIAACSGIVAVILSLARGSWLALLAAAAILVLFGWFGLSAGDRKKYFVSVGGAVVMMCALLTPFYERIYERLTADDQGSAAIRLPMMENALRMIESNPLTGVGLNGYRANMTKYDETGIFVSQVFPNPVHNIFIHITAEAGIPGGVIFCLLILAVLFECFKSMTARDRLLFALALGAAAAIIAWVISGIKEPAALGSVRPPMRTGFFLFGTALAVSRLRRLQNFR